jgi:hypothetical protein
MDQRLPEAAHSNFYSLLFDKFSKVIDRNSVSVGH